MTDSAFPMEYSIPDDNSVANWRPLVHWILAIPHLIVAGAINYAAQLVAAISWFAILFTGNLPEGMARFMVMSQRYSVRTYAYVLWLTESYPPFSFEMTNEDPADHDVLFVVQPQLEDRNRLTVFFRLILMIPLAIVGFVWSIVACAVGFVSWFVVLFTGKYPEGMRSTVNGALRYGYRVSVYGFLLTDTYPSFSLND